MRMNYYKAIARAEKKIAKMNKGNQLAMYTILMRELDNELYEVYMKKHILFEMELSNDVDFFYSHVEGDTNCLCPKCDK